MRPFSLALLLTCCLSIFSTALAAPSFQQAKADYEKGKYALALGQFQTFKASYPNNALVHYYVAMCQQALGRFNQAKTEYKWVVDSRDPTLAANAAKGLAQLSSARGTGGGGSSSAASSSVASSTPAPAAASQKIAMGKVKKVIEFWSAT